MKAPVKSSLASRLCLVLLSSFAAMVLAAAHPQAAAAAVVDGSVAIAYYGLGDASDSGLEDAGADARLLERYRLNVSGLGAGVSLHSSFTTRQWFGGDRDGDNALRLHQLHARYRSGAWGHRHEIAVGRHWMTAGGMGGLLDGVSATIDRRVVRATAFAGSRGTEDRDDVRWPDLDRSRWWGLSGQLSPARWAELMAGYDAARSGGEDDQEILFAGAEVRPTVAFRVGCRLRYDGTRETWRSRSLLAAWRPDARRELWMEAASRRPEIGYTSFFSTFRNLAEHRRLELRGGGRVPLATGLELGAYGAAIEHGEASPVATPGQPRFEAREPDSWSQDGRIDLVWRGQMLGYYLARGFGGERDGVSWALHRSMGRGFRVTFDGNRLDYRYGTGVAVDDDLTTLRAGLDADLARNTWASAEIERLVNRESDSDWRFLLRLRRGFRFGAE